MYLLKLIEVNIFTMPIEGKAMLVIGIPLVEVIILLLKREVPVKYLYVQVRMVARRI